MTVLRFDDACKAHEVDAVYLRDVLNQEEIPCKEAVMHERLKYQLSKLHPSAGLSEFSEAVHPYCSKHEEP